MIYDGRRSKRDPGLLLNKLFEAKELIETADVLRVIPRRKVRGCYCEITVCVTKKNNFFAFFIQIGKNLLQLTEGTNRVTRWPIP